MLQAGFSYDQHVEFCFHPPCQPAGLPPPLHNPELRPVLHLLRRDLVLIYGPEEEAYCPASMKPAFIALLSMLCGFDMLSAMYFGEDPISDDYRRAQKLLDENGLKDIRLYQAGRKYKRFLIEVGKLSELEGAFLWVLRNSLAHTYSLNLSEKSYRNNSITAVPSDGTLLKVDSTLNPRRYVLNLWELKKRFLATASNFKILLKSAAPQSELRLAFEKQVQSCGYIKVEKEIVPVRGQTL